LHLWYQPSIHIWSGRRTYVRAGGRILMGGGGMGGRGRERKCDYKIETQFSKFRVSPSSQLLQQTYHHHKLLYFANLGMSPKLVALPWCPKHPSSRGYKYSISNTRPLVCRSTLKHSSWGGYKYFPSNTRYLAGTSTLSQTLVLWRVQVFSLKNPSSTGYKVSLLNTRPLVGRSTLKHSS